MWVCLCFCVSKKLFSSTPGWMAMVYARDTQYMTVHMKTTFNGRRTSMEGDLQGKMTFNGRRSSMVEELQCKTTFRGFLNWSLTLKTMSCLLLFRPLLNLCVLPIQALLFL